MAAARWPRRRLRRAASDRFARWQADGRRSRQWVVVERWCVPWRGRVLAAAAGAAVSRQLATRNANAAVRLVMDDLRPKAGARSVAGMGVKQSPGRSSPRFPGISGSDAGRLKVRKAA